jgi:hypothetical protein
MSIGGNWRGGEFSFPDVSPRRWHLPISVTIETKPRSTRVMFCAANESCVHANEVWRSGVRLFARFRRHGVAMELRLVFGQLFDEAGEDPDSALGQLKLVGCECDDAREPCRCRWPVRLTRPHLWLHDLATRQPEQLADLYTMSASRAD